MKRRILAALAILMGEPIPHDWAECPNGDQWSWTWPVGVGESTAPIQMPRHMPINDWETVS